VLQMWGPVPNELWVLAREPNFSGTRRTLYLVYDHQITFGVLLQEHAIAKEMESEEFNPGGAQNG